MKLTHRKIARHRALEDAVLLKDVFVRLIAEPPVMHQIADIFNICSPHRWERFTLGVEQPAEGLKELWMAIAAGTSIEMGYAGGSRPGYRRRVTPQRGLEMRGTLYLAVFCHHGR